ncbi:MAG: ACT domain-containing protein, partial [Phycisphaerae bacterium]|nr:ACT domain-containing protein [Phycisphaerae bacterium]
PVNVINAPVLAEQRGVEVEQITSAKVKEFSNIMEVTIHTDKTKRSAKGTIFGNRFPRIISIDGYRIEMKPEGYALIIFNDDMPGVVGRFGTILGSRDINIAHMTFSSKKKPKKAVVALNLDSPAPDDLVAEIESLDFVDAVCRLDLPELPSVEEGD